MRRAGRLAGLLVAACAATGCVGVEGELPGTGRGAAPPAQAPPDAQDARPDQQMARDVFDRVNDERRERGLDPVEWNEALAAAARAYSAEMARTGRFEHQDVGALLQSGELEGFTSVGENIFQSTGPAPAGVAHTGWMRSDGHRSNLLNPGWDRLGVGFHCAEGGAVWATQLFGRTAGADRPPVAQETPPPEPVARPGADGPSCS
jgi:uncharacterized protein YkwD